MERAIILGELFWPMTFYFAIQHVIFWRTDIEHGHVIGVHIAALSARNDCTPAIYLRCVILYCSASQYSDWIYYYVGPEVSRKLLVFVLAVTMNAWTACYLLCVICLIMPQQALRYICRWTVALRTCSSIILQRGVPVNTRGLSVIRLLWTLWSVWWIDYSWSLCGTFGTYWACWWVLNYSVRIAHFTIRNFTEWFAVHFTPTPPPLLFGYHYVVHILFGPGVSAILLFVLTFFGNYDSQIYHYTPGAGMFAVFVSPGAHWLKLLLFSIFCALWTPLLNSTCTRYLYCSWCWVGIMRAAERLAHAYVRYMAFGALIFCTYFTAYYGRCQVNTLHFLRFKCAVGGCCWPGMVWIPRLRWYMNVLRWNFMPLSSYSYGDELPYSSISARVPRYLWIPAGTEDISRIIRLWNFLGRYRLDSAILTEYTRCLHGNYFGSVWTRVLLRDGILLFLFVILMWCIRTFTISILSLGLLLYIIPLFYLGWERYYSNWTYDFTSRSDFVMLAGGIYSGGESFPWWCDRFYTHGIEHAVSSFTEIHVLMGMLSAHIRCVYLSRWQTGAAGVSRVHSLFCCTINVWNIAVAPRIVLLAILVRVFAHVAFCLRPDWRIAGGEQNYSMVLEEVVQTFTRRNCSTIRCRSLLLVLTFLHCVHFGGSCASLRCLRIWNIICLFAGGLHWCGKCSLLTLFWNYSSLLSILQLFFWRCPLPSDTWSPNCLLLLPKYSVSFYSSDDMRNMITCSVIVGRWDSPTVAVCMRGGVFWLRYVDC